jgi:vanillate O-demethylase ferredoxin subunit
MTTLRMRVLRKTTEAEGIASFELASADGTPLPPYTAGAHVDVHGPGGIVRPYSLYGDPADTSCYRIAVLREPASRGGSAAMHDAVKAGDEITIGAPRNLFPLADGAASHLLLAGGIGITPLLAMVQVLASREADFTLHYCTRSAARTAFADTLRASRFANRVHLHHDDGPAAQRLDLAALLASPPAGRHLYVCGPQGFMDAVLNAARAAGWPADRLHSESFTPAPAPQEGDRAFEVMLAKSGRVIPVAADCSVVQALAAAGVVLPTSCEQGICGTCLTRVVDGVPEHRDQYLTDEERAANDQFLPCCSRAQSARLVLEL